MINLQAYSSGMYAVQALWTLAREKRDVLPNALTRLFLMRGLQVRSRRQAA